MHVDRLEVDRQPLERKVDDDIPEAWDERVQHARGEADPPDAHMLGTGRDILDDVSPIRIGHGRAVEVRQCHDRTGNRRSTGGIRDGTDHAAARRRLGSHQRPNHAEEPNGHVDPHCSAVVRYHGDGRDASTRRQEAGRACHKPGGPDGSRLRVEFRDAVSAT